MSTAIEFNNVSKLYRLGLVSSGTLSNDLKRWWTMNILGKEDPFLKVGSVNDRSKAADSDYVWALKDIDFKVEQGDVVGIIGKNGAGKSTLLKLLSRVTGPTTGTIKAKGRIGSLLEVGTGFHPEMTGRENIYMNGAILGMTKQEITSKLDEIIDFSGCERYIDTPVKRYSSGMMVRLGFAVAAHLDPEILVVDEVLAVGDAEFQKKAIGKMQDVSKGEGRTVLFVSHNMASIRALCKTGILLENGQVKFAGEIDDVVSFYVSNNDINYRTPLISREDRRGDGRARFTKMEMISGGKQVDNIFSTQPFSFHFYIHSQEELSNVEIRFSIYNPMSVLVFSSNTRFSATQTINIHQGDNHIYVSFDSLPLSFQRYYMHIGIYMNQDDVIDVIENAFTFNIVESDICQTGRVYLDRSSILALPHKWVVE